MNAKDAFVLAKNSTSDKEYKRLFEKIETRIKRAAEKGEVEVTILTGAQSQYTPVIVKKVITMLNHDGFQVTKGQDGFTIDWSDGGFF